MITRTRRARLAPVIEHRIIPDRSHRAALAGFLTEHQTQTGEARWTNGPNEITISDRLRRLVPDELLTGARIYRQAADLDRPAPGIPLTAPPSPEPEAVDADLSASQDSDGASTPPEPQKTPTTPTPADLARALSKGGPR